MKKTEKKQKIKNEILTGDFLTIKQIADKLFISYERTKDLLKELVEDNEISTISKEYSKRRKEILNNEFNKNDYVRLKDLCIKLCLSMSGALLFIRQQKKSISDHNEKVSNEIKNKIVESTNKNPTFSSYQIAREIKVDRKHIARFRKELLLNNLIKKRKTHYDLIAELVDDFTTTEIANKLNIDITIVSRNKTKFLNKKKTS